MNEKQVVRKIGEVLESLPNVTFKVVLEDNSEVLAHLSGKMRLFKIKILSGDKVMIEFSPHDLTKGRIIQRL